MVDLAIPVSRLAALTVAPADTRPIARLRSGGAYTEVMVAPATDRDEQ